MIFNSHSKLAGLHAFLSPSKASWTNYDEDKLDRVYTTAMAARRGDQLHAFAADAIRLGQNLPRTKQTLNMYVNDAIGYRMIPEQPLFFSENCFGTADAIQFKRNLLRIHDLKTGVIPASFRQHEVYAAIFCLEYNFKPTAIKIELRIYQNDEIRIMEGDPLVITNIMDKIVQFDKRINMLRVEDAL